MGNRSGLNRRALGWLASASMSALLLAGGAEAQTAAGDGTSATQTIETVVVTADKRDTDLQHTPMAITAISADTLDQAHVVDARDLNGMVPSLVISTSEGFNRSVTIRGIGFNAPQNDAAQPSVSYHSDGIYIANPVALDTGFLDLDHVEVVRGPQGTVYGQNSTGGTINVIDKQPSLTAGYTGDALLEGGSYDLVHFQGAVNIPVTDTFALRASLDSDNHAGYSVATQVPGYPNGYDLDNDHSFHGRLIGLWQPTDRLTLSFRAEYAQARDHESEGKSLFDPDPNPYRESSDFPGRFIYNNEIYSGTASYDLGFATIKAMGSYQWVGQKGSDNEDGLSLALTSPFHEVQSFFHNSLTHTGEIDLISKTGGRFDWIVGAFNLDISQHVGYDEQALAVGDPPAVNQLYTNPSVLPANNYFYSLSTLNRQSTSVYGQGTFHITDALRVTAGLRQTHDQNNTTICDYLCGSAPIFNHQSNDALTGKGGIEYDLTPNNMAYATYSTGFKPGGGNISNTPVLLSFQFQPEQIRSYEAGLKNTLFDERVHLNVSGFYYNYTNLQFETEDVIPFQGGVANIPKVQVYGLEMDGSAILPWSLRLDGNVTVEKSKILSHFNALDNTRATQIDNQDGLFTDADLADRAAAYSDIYGNSIPNLPNITAFASLTRTWDFGNGGTLSTVISAKYRSSYINTVFGNEIINGLNIYRVPSYVLGDFYAGYDFPDSGWRASLTVKNIANTPAVDSQFTNQFGGQTTRSYVIPREFITSIAYHF